MTDENRNQVSRGIYDALHDLRIATEDLETFVVAHSLEVVAMFALNTAYLSMLDGNISYHDHISHSVFILDTEIRAAGGIFSRRHTS